MQQRLQRRGGGTAEKAQKIDFTNMATDHGIVIDCLSVKEM